MLHPDAGLDAAVAEDHVQELGQFTGSYLNGIADHRFITVLTRGLEGLDPSEHVVPDHSLRNFIGREFHGLLDTDVLCLETCFLLAAEDTVGHGKTIAREH